MTPGRPEGIDPKYLKVSYQPSEGPLSRRNLLFGSLTPRYEVVAAVETEACTAWKGCVQCLAACPQGAIAVDGGAAAIDKAKCVGCGACLPVCPVRAIRQPLLDPERLEAELRALLSTAEVAAAPRVLVLMADGGAPPPEAMGLRVLRLPSIGAVSAWLLLRAFTLGFFGVAVLPCPVGCRHRCDQARWDQTLWFTLELLTRLGVGADRLAVVRRDDIASAPGLSAFCQAVAGLGPHRLCTVSHVSARQAPTLARLLQDLAAFRPDPSAPLAGVAIPFGALSVGADRCTLCGACPERCPTGALEVREDEESSRLLFDHGRCVACEACVRVCPERAVEVTRRLDLARLGGQEVLAEDRVARCARCGAAIAPKRMLERVQRCLNGTQAASARALGRYCASCLALQSLAGVRGP